MHEPLTQIMILHVHAQGVKQSVLLFTVAYYNIIYVHVAVMNKKGQIKSRWMHMQ